MTAQIAERLHFEGREVAMCVEPLHDFFELSGQQQPKFAFDNTALWRRYVGTWEIREGRLYLIALSGTLEDGSIANVATIFPDFPERVFAHWYSGTLRLPQGKLLRYVHLGYGSVYEADLQIAIEKGVVTQSRVNSNGVSGDQGGPDGYSVGGMTVFAPPSKNTSSPR